MIYVRTLFDSILKRTGKHYHDTWKVTVVVRGRRQNDIRIGLGTGTMDLTPSYTDVTLACILKRDITYDTKSTRNVIYQWQA